MKIPVLLNWSIRNNSQSPYNAPETQRIKVTGDVFFSSKFNDGTRITTSWLIKVDGCKITTFSGSVYQLSHPDSNYLFWCRKHGCHVPTPKEPIKLS